MGFADITMILQTVLADSSGKLKHCGHMVQLHWGSSIPLMIDRLIQIPVPSNWCIDPYDLPKQPPTRNWDFSWPITVWTDIPCREKKNSPEIRRKSEFPHTKVRSSGSKIMTFWRAPYRSRLGRLSDWKCVSSCFSSPNKMSGKSFGGRISRFTNY